MQYGRLRMMRISMEETRGLYQSAHWGKSYSTKAHLRLEQDLLTNNTQRGNLEAMFNSIHHLSAQRNTAITHKYPLLEELYCLFIIREVRMP